MGRLSNRDVDDMNRVLYEDALGEEEPWALEAYEYHQAEHRGQADE